MNYLEIHINTDDDFIINDCHNWIYIERFPLVEGENAKRGFERWLSQVKLTGFKSEAGYDWLDSIPKHYAFDPEQGGGGGGNWEFRITITSDTLIDDAARITKLVQQLGYDLHEGDIEELLKGAK